MLHPAAEQSGQPNGGMLPTRRSFTANPALRLAQLALLAQGAIGLSNEIGLLRGTMGLSHLGSGVNLDVTASLTTNYGTGIAVICGVLILGGLLVSLPSQIIRSLLVILEIVALGVTLAAHFGGGSVLGFVTVLTLGASGSGMVAFGAVVGIQSAVIYLLGMHPPTYKAFDRRPTWISYASR